MQLFIDLGKAMNTSRLVKRAVQVRGQNGKIFTRMQWVSPDEAKSPSIRPQSHEDVPERTQKEHIDEHVKNMSREDKYKHLADHKVEWKRNEKSEAIDHKNAVMALKEHLYKNPHLAGAEHLPTERGATDEEVLNHSIKKFTDKYKNHGELLHRMMHHLGVSDSPEDPRQKDPQKGAIEHMRKMMKLKAHLKSKPDDMHSMMHHEEYGTPFDDGDRKEHGSLEVKKPQPKPESKPKEEPKVTAPKEQAPLPKQLGKVPREKLYEIMKEMGIADADPLVADPDDKGAPIKHMRFMMRLKQDIVSRPDLMDKLGLSNEEPQEQPKDDTKEESSSKLPKKEVHEVDDLFSKMSREDKEEWISKMRSHHLISSRVNSGLGTPQNYIHALHAVKELFKNHPDVWEQNKKQVESDALVGSTKISNEDMTVVLRQLVGLKGGLTKERATSGFRKQQSWEFNVASTAEIMKNDDGDAVLSIIDAGFTGEDFNEIEVPLQEVIDFLKERKEKKGTGVARTKPVTETLPLHKQGAGEIWSAILNDSANITPETTKALGRDIYNMWQKAGFTKDFATLALQGGRSLPPKTIQKVLSSMGVPLRDKGSSIMDINSASFKKAVYGHMITKTKPEDATSLIIDNKAHPNDTWALHESAKQWSSEERASARQDFIKKNISILGDNSHLHDDEQKMHKLSSFIHRSTSYLPFDMMTDMMAKGFSKIEFNSDKVGSHYDTDNRTVVINHQHLNAGLDEDMKLENFHHMWKDTVQKGDKTYSVTRGTAGFANTVAHEFAHAVDHFLSSQSNSKVASNENEYLNWTGTDTSKKYVDSLGLNPNMVKDSYTKAIKSSNPDFKYVKSSNNGTPYAMHLDSFLTSYEGRIYRSNLSSTPAQKGEALTDDSKGNNGLVGLEHWAESVSRVANAVRAHKEYMQKNPDSDLSLDAWAEKMHNDSSISHRVASQASVTGDLTQESSKNKLEARGMEGEKTFGKAYHIMKQVHPELVDGIHKLFFRGDFVGEVKKSEYLYILTDKGV